MRMLLVARILLLTLLPSTCKVGFSGPWAGNFLADFSAEPTIQGTPATETATNELDQDEFNAGFKNNARRFFS